ncbi:MAG: hypothetical protein SF187_21200 [Deltaproteobacteria bacterium]|nr:hypothetical protein [Deltaproteobacteria bacterium]
MFDSCRVHTQICESQGAARRNAGSNAMAEELENGASVRSDEPQATAVGIWPAFAHDRFLLATFCFLSVLAAAPLFLTPFLPLQDLPDHTGLAALMRHVLSGGEVSRRHYQLQYFPVPYWTVYSILGLGSWGAGPLVAAKLLTFIAAICTPLGAIRMAIALKRSPRVGLCAFAFAWDYNVSWGFLAHVIGFGVALLYLARTIEMMSLRDVWRSSWIGCLLALTHAHATLVWMAASAVTAFVSKDRRRRLQLHGLAALAPILTMLPWIISRIAARAGGKARSPSWPSFSQRWSSLFDHTFFTFTGPLVPTLLFAVFVTLFLGPPLLGLLGLKHRTKDTHWRIVWGLYGLAWLLYLTAPSGIYWPINQQFIYQRQASFIVLLGLFLPAPPLDARRFTVLVPGLVAAVLAMVVGIVQVADFGTRAAPFLNIIAAVPRESRILTLTLDDHDPVSKRTPYNQFHAYIVAEKGGYDPYLFNNPSHPIVFSKAPQPPRPRWNDMAAFSMQKHAPAFDYIVVQGLTHDPVVQGPIEGTSTYVTRITESGRWRLYRVEHEAPATP